MCNPRYNTWLQQELGILPISACQGPSLHLVSPASSTPVTPVTTTLSSPSSGSKVSVVGPAMAPPPSSSPQVSLGPAAVPSSSLDPQDSLVPLGPQDSLFWCQ